MINAIVRWYMECYSFLALGFIQDFHQDPIRTVFILAGVGGAIICFCTFVISGLMWQHIKWKRWFFQGTEEDMWNELEAVSAKVIDKKPKTIWDHN